MTLVIQRICRACVFYCILINVLVLANESPSPSRNNNLIIFPGRMRTNNSNHTQLELPSQRFVANLTRCAVNNQTFCTKNDNYPAEYVRQILHEHSHRYANYFVSDLVSNDVSIRVDDFDTEYLCDSYEKLIFPTSGKTQDGSELYILNTGEHKQGVRVSLCRNSGKPCRMAEVFPIGYKTECKQLHVYRQLLSLGPDGKPVPDYFEFPACCSCALHHG